MRSLFQYCGWVRALILFFLLVRLFNGLSLAQAIADSRIIYPVDDQTRVTLKGNVHPLAAPRYDQGAVSDSFPVERLFLILQRSAEREAALRRFIQDAHRLGSPSYHRWLTPEQVGELYGPDDSDIAAVTGWLQGHGFSVARVTRGRTAIEFSGSARQLREAFHTEIHTYLVKGEEHHANSLDPQIPAALAPVVAGLTSMNDFPSKSHAVFLGQALYNPTTHQVTPEWTWPGNTPVLALGPGDFAVQYNLNPLYDAGINGKGVTIGIIGASDIVQAALVNYRSLFGLPPVNFKVVLDGTDPSLGGGNWATAESYLDVEVAGAVAPGAAINLYTAADTSVQSGLLLAAQRAVDDDQASVLSTSYGQCEQELGTASNQFWASLWEQAAAQGQTSFVSAGDGGSAGCDNFDAPQPAEGGLAVSGFASTPWNVSVGGTDFYYSTYNQNFTTQLAQLATYWDLTPTDTPAISLLQPVPEQPWNRAFGFDLYDGGVYDPSANGATIVAGSGGASTIYAKPSWQSGKGVPLDTARHIPDLSLFAAAGENGSFYVVCGGPNGCTDFQGQGVQVSGAGGTSASTPAMAGIMALINQKYGPQGQANFSLYPLAAQHPSIFHDVTISSNNVPCQQGTGDCNLSSIKDNTKGFYTLGHYYANSGYDQATGLGSVDANLLVQSWNSLSFTPTNTALVPSQTTFVHGTPIHLNVSVSGAGGTPSGDVGLVTTASAVSDTSMGELALTEGAVSATANNLPGGKYQMVAKYTGDTTFAPSDSPPVGFDVAPEDSSVSISGSYWSNDSNSFVPLANGGSYSYGTYIALDAQPRGVSASPGSTDGMATGTVSFTDSGTGGSSGAINITSTGVAEWVPALAFPVGNNDVSAVYSGDTSFNASSSSFTFTITKGQAFGSLVARPSPIALGSSTALELEAATVYRGPLPPPPNSTYNFSAPVAPTGTATFYLGKTVLGTVPMVPSYNGLEASWATLNVSSLPLGTDTVTATYNGDGNYNSATTSFNVVVEQPATLSATANPNPVTQAEYTAITATVTGLKGLPVPTGTVTFLAAEPGSDWTDTEILRNGSATSAAILGGFFPVGSASVDASYSGDSTYGPGDVNLSLTISKGNTPPFTISATPVVIASPGATAGNGSTVTITPGGGFVGAVYLSCALTTYPTGAHYLPTCSIPASGNITGTGAITAAMTINSTAPGSGARLASLPRHPGWLLANAGVFLGAILFLGIPARGSKFRLVGIFLGVLITLGSLAACGGSSANSGGGGNPVQGTTPGTYTFTVSGSFTANGVTQGQTSVTVTIQ